MIVRDIKDLLGTEREVHRSPTDCYQRHGVNELAGRQHAIGENMVRHDR